MTKVADILSAAGSIASGKSAKSPAAGMSVDTDTFLTLLVAQLANQDPLNPQKDTEFITQLAQMTTLEEMQHISSQMSSIQAYSLVGQYAYAESLDADNGTASCLYGKIESIVNESSTYYAIINGNTVKTDDIVQIFDSSLLSADYALIELSSLIGKTVTGSYETEDGTPANVTGTVSSVTYEDGVVFALVDGFKVSVDKITVITEQTVTETEQIQAGRPEIY